MLYSHRRVLDIPDFPIPGQIGNHDRGFPPRFPANFEIGNRGNGNWGFPGLLAHLAPRPEWHSMGTKLVSWRRKWAVVCTVAALRYRSGREAHRGSRVGTLAVTFPVLIKLEPRTQY